MRESRVIDGVPRVVAEESGLAFMLFLHHGRRELKVREMCDGAVGQNGPKTVVNELLHFLAQEGGMFDGRTVAPTFDAGLLGLKGPRGGRKWAPAPRGHATG